MRYLTPARHPSLRPSAEISAPQINAQKAISAIAIVISYKGKVSDERALNIALFQTDPTKKRKDLCLHTQISERHVVGNNCGCALLREAGIDLGNLPPCYSFSFPGSLLFPTIRTDFCVFEIYVDVLALQ